MAGSSADVDLALQMLALKTTCSHCGKLCPSLKRCTVCQHASYCGAECQAAAWKKHKKTCLHLKDVFDRVREAQQAGDWRGVLKWEGRMEAMMADCPRSASKSESIVSAFMDAHRLAISSSSSREHKMAVNRLAARRIELLGELERFRDQGAALCLLGQTLIGVDTGKGYGEEAARYFNRARDLGAAHGFFSVECDACLGLGQIAMVDQGRHEEGLDLCRNALAAAPLCEYEEDYFELRALEMLTGALLKTDGLDELEPLIPRYREAAEAESHDEISCGAFFHVLKSLYFSARLHEVLFISLNDAPWSLQPEPWTLDPGP